MAVALAGCGSISVSADDGATLMMHDGAATIDAAGNQDGTGGADGGGDVDGVVGGDSRQPDGADPEVATPACTVEINEVQTGGQTALDEFVELYHTCPDRPFDLAGFRLVYRSDIGATDVLIVSFGASVIAAGRPFFVCANASSAIPADASFTNGLRDTGGGLALRGPDGRIIDSVGWGTASNAFVETAPAPAALAGQSIERLPDGRDTDDNSKDFAVRTDPPSPGGPN